MFPIVCLAALAADTCSSREAGTGSFISAEKQLVRCLLNEYDRIARPALAANETVEVVLDVTTANIVELVAYFVVVSMAF